MVISYWSSDVCSSDLADGVDRDVRAYGCDRHGLRGLAACRHRRIGGAARDDRALPEGRRLCRPCVGDDRDQPDRDDGQAAVELGRTGVRGPGRHHLPTALPALRRRTARTEKDTSELQSLMSGSYAVSTPNKNTQNTDPSHPDK